MSTISHDQDNQRFTTEVDGQRAELDYTVADGVMTITHTRVPREISGRGIAAELMQAALQVAAERGWRAGNNFSGDVGGVAHLLCQHRAFEFPARSGLKRPACPLEFDEFRRRTDLRREVERLAVEAM